MRRLLAFAGVALVMFVGAGCDGMVGGDEPGDRGPLSMEQAAQVADFEVTRPLKWESQLWRSPRLGWCMARGRSCADAPCCEGTTCARVPSPSGTGRVWICTDAHAWRAWAGPRWREQ